MIKSIRPRRLRQSSAVRDLCAENILNTTDLIQAFFLCDGVGIKIESPSMPSAYTFSLDMALLYLNELMNLGILAVAIFPVIAKELKNENGTHSLDETLFLYRAIEEIKNKFPKMIIIADVALDPYTSHGHDGLVDAYGKVINDATVNILSQQALLLAKSGADIIAPSDMMDGRIGAIRYCLEESGFVETIIMSYAAKYASGTYGPFRQAVGSDSCLRQKDKKHYQMDFRNSKEALTEVHLDVEQGADIILIKPAVLYLDIIKSVTDELLVPVFAFQVSGEYAMIAAAAERGLVNLDDMLLESLTAIKRSGARAIITYAAARVAKLLCNF